MIGSTSGEKGGSQKIEHRAVRDTRSFSMEVSTAEKDLISGARNLDGSALGRRLPCRDVLVHPALCLFLVIVSGKMILYIATPTAKGGFAPCAQNRLGVLSRIVLDKHRPGGLAQGPPEEGNYLLW